MGFWEILAALGIFEVIKFLILEPVKDVVGDYREKKKNRKWLASEIIKICSEGRSSSWRKKPGSVRHLVYVSDLATGVDEKIGEDLSFLTALWQWRAIRKEPKQKTDFEQKQLQEEGETLSELSKKLVKWAHGQRGVRLIG